MSHHFHERPSGNERFSHAENRHHESGLHINIELNLLSLHGQSCHLSEPFARHYSAQPEVRFVPPIAFEYHQPVYRVMPELMMPPGYFNELEPLRTCPSPYLPVPRPYFPGHRNCPEPFNGPVGGYTDGGGPENRGSLNETRKEPWREALMEPAPEPPRESAEPQEAAAATAPAEPPPAVPETLPAKDLPPALPAKESAGAASPLAPAEPAAEVATAAKAQPSSEVLPDPLEGLTTPPSPPALALAQAKAEATQEPQPTTPQAILEALKPMVVVQSHMLKPSVLNFKADPKDQTNRAYNPLGPLGLTEGFPGSSLEETTAGVLERRVNWNGNKSECDTSGKLDDSGSSIVRLHIHKPDGSGLDYNWGDTNFKTHDTYSENKLASRITNYDRGISMNFQTEQPGQSLHIDGVRKVESRYDCTQAGYSTIITNEKNEKWNFTSDQNGIVVGVQRMF